jgi:antitoxin (DNA-binding transcriptional repressor) of toxin-antitoxin stability system
MTRMTVRDVRLHWPKAEKALAEGEEILVTRDAQPVARILPYVPPRGVKRKRLEPRVHRRWMKRFWKTKSFGPSTDEWLARDRGD